MIHPYIDWHGPINEYQLNRIQETIYKALDAYPRLMAFRVDLGLPVDWSSWGIEYSDMPTHFANVDSAVITRFINSLANQLQHEQTIKKQNGLRIRRTDMFYVWVREIGMDGNWHYHLLIMLNKDTYAFLGKANGLGTGIIRKINVAWSRALNIDIEDACKLTVIPSNPCYYLNANDDQCIFSEKLNELMHRVSYLAKRETKQYGSGHHNFGTGRKKISQ